MLKYFEVCHKITLNPMSLNMSCNRAKRLNRTGLLVRDQLSGSEACSRAMHTSVMQRPFSLD